MDEAPAQSGRSQWLCVLLACFEGARSAPKYARAAGKEIRLTGAVVLSVVVLRVTAKRTVRVYEPRKVIRGGATVALTWGVFGLVTGSWTELLSWGVLGLISGALWAYFREHPLSEQMLARIAESFPSDSSAVLAFIAVAEPDRVLAAVATHAPGLVTLGAIGPELSADVVGGTTAHEEPKGPPVLTMMLFRYRGRATAMKMIKKLGLSEHDASVRVELVIEVNAKGRAHVHNPRLGVRAQAKSSMVSWGLNGLAVGALADLSGDAGLIAGLRTGIPLLLGYAIFGAIAGGLAGLWVGRGLSGQQLRSVGPALLAPDTSLLLAWGDSAPSKAVLDTLATPDSKARSSRLGSSGVV